MRLDDSFGDTLSANYFHQWLILLGKWKGLSRHRIIFTLEIRLVVALKWPLGSNMTSRPDSGNIKR